MFLIMENILGFTYIDDISQQYLGCLKKQTRKNKFETYNLGNNKLST